jgi:hypothetical protein
VEGVDLFRRAGRGLAGVETEARSGTGFYAGPAGDALHPLDDPGFAGAVDLDRTGGAFDFA